MTLDMGGWVAAGLVFFAYVAIVAAVLPALPARRRALALTGSAAGLVLVVTAYLTVHRPLLYEWILPPAVLLAAYWTSGLLFVAPMARAERALEALDRALGVDDVAAATPRLGAEILELAYLAVYPVVPFALAVHVLTSAAPRPERFWTVILITDFICFGVLPFVQTRPPRALRTGEPWTSTVRRVNLRLLGSTSIQANTFPSGHAAEALASALLVLYAPWPLALLTAVVALLITAGTVLGRYHYAADAIAGWVVALAVWLTVVGL